MKKFIYFFGAIALFLTLSLPSLAFDFETGNPIQYRTYVDTYSNFSIIDTNNSFTNGFVTQIDYWARNTNTFKFLIVDGAKQVLWKSDLITPSGTGEQTYPLTVPFEVSTGWHVGVYFVSTGTIPFDYNGGSLPAYYEGNNAGEPALNETLVPAGTTNRFYSILAKGVFSLDTDNDGVHDDKDKCLNTEVDSWYADGVLGTNRWQYMSYKEGEFGWYQNKPVAKKGSTKEPVFMKSLEYTYGCSGEQILYLLGEPMNGHRKFGLSSSVVEDFHKDYADGVLDGIYYVETVTVPSNKALNTMSSNLVLGEDYLLKSKGTWTNSLNIADTEFASKDLWATWFDGYDFSPYILGEGEFDLMVDNGFVNWGTYSPSHEYTIPYVGTGNPVKLMVSDGDSNVLPITPNVGWYGDNSGNLTVDIYFDL